MRLFEEPVNTHEAAVAAIVAARALAKAMLAAPYEEVCRQKLVTPLLAGQLFLDKNDGDPEVLAEMFLEILEERAPGYRDIALNHDTQDYRFADIDLEAMRNAWARLDTFLWLRQRLLDYAEAQRQLFKLNLRAIQRAPA